MSYEVRHPEMENLQRRIADQVRAQLPAGYVFSLFIFEASDKPGGNCFYISTADRPSMIQAIKEWLARQVM